MDLNQRPSDYEPDELTKLLYPATMAEDEGFEPPRGSLRLSVFKTDPFNQAWVIFHKQLLIYYIKYNSN